MRGVLVVGHRRRVGAPRIAIACTGGTAGRGRRPEKNAAVDSGCHPVHRARWYRVAGNRRWSSGQPGRCTRSSPAKYLCTKLTQKLIAMVCRSGFRRTPSALHRTPESTRSSAACGTRSALSTMRENSISSRHLTDLRAARTMPGSCPRCFRASPKRPTVRIGPVQVGVAVTRWWGDPSTPHRCTHGRTTR